MPDTSPGASAPDGSASREASARAAVSDAAFAGPPAGAAPAAVRATLTVPDSVSMVALLGSGDELLRLIEAEVDADVHVRGNEIAVTGQPADNAFAVRVFDELIALLGTGQALRPDSVRRVIGDAAQRRRRAAGRRPQPRHHQPARAARSGPRR